MYPQGTFKGHDKIRPSRHEDLNFRHRTSIGAALHIHASRHSFQFTRIDHLCKSPSRQPAISRLLRRKHLVQNLAHIYKTSLFYDI